MQKSFSGLEYAAKKKLTRRDRVLAKIDSVTPWSKLHELIEPHYPKVEGEIFETINGHLAAQGLMMREGTIVDATGNVADAL